MKIRKVLSSNQRKRTLHRNKIRLVNRRHTQFSLELFNHQQMSFKQPSELHHS